MNALTSFVPRGRAIVRRIPWKAALALAAVVGIPYAVGSGAYELASIVYIGSEGENISLGPSYDYQQRRGQMIEKAAYATSDPAARFESTGARPSSDWRLISRGKVAFTGQGDSLFGEIPDRMWPSATRRADWGSGKLPRSYKLAMTSVGRVEQGLVIELWKGDCQKALQWASPYALRRMRGAWGHKSRRTWDIEIGGSWSAPGQAQRACAEGIDGGKDPEKEAFVMLFEVPGDVPAAGEAAAR